MSGELYNPRSGLLQEDDIGPAQTGDDASSGVIELLSSWCGRGRLVGATGL